MFRKPPNSCSHAKTLSNEEVDTQFPQFPTQIELENIAIEGRGGSYTRKKKGPRLFFPIEEDKLLISLWLNVSLDSIFGDGKKLEAFWKRIIENYNTHYDNLSERSSNQLKSQWPKTHTVI